MRGPLESPVESPFDFPFEVPVESPVEYPFESLLQVTILSDYRKQAVKLRRWVGPQREALKDLLLKGSLWLLKDYEDARQARLPRNL